MSHIPMLFVRGTHYDVGYTLGSTYRRQITEYYESYAWLAEFEAFYRTPDGRDFCEGLWGVCRTRFPHYLDELRGMAEGAGLDMMTVMLLNTDRELGTKLGLYDDVFNDVTSPAPPTGCTDMLLNTQEEMIIGHNEDWIPSMKDKDVVVCADIESYHSADGRMFPPESFVVHTWPGLLFGMNSGFNRHGLVFSIDHTYPRHVGANKTADLFLCRHLVAAESLDHVTTILRDVGCGAAVGFSANFGFDGCDTLWNAEVSVCPDKRESSLDLLDVRCLDPANPGLENGVQGFAAHFNNYERLDVDALTLSHCLGRKDCLDSLPTPRDRKSLLEALGNVSGEEPEKSIYQDTSQGLNWGTVATVVYDLRRRKMLLYKENPSSAKALAQIPFDMVM